MKQLKLNFLCNIYIRTIKLWNTIPDRTYKPKTICISGFNHFDSQFNLFTDKSCFFIEVNQIKINHKKNPFSFLVYVHLQCTFSSQHLGFICNQQLPFQQRYYVSVMFFFIFSNNKSLNRSSKIFIWCSSVKCVVFSSGSICAWLVQRFCTIFLYFYYYKFQNWLLSPKLIIVKIQIYF